MVDVPEPSATQVDAGDQRVDIVRSSFGDHQLAILALLKVKFTLSSCKNAASYSTLISVNLIFLFSVLLVFVGV